jgi:MarR family
MDREELTALRDAIDLLLKCPDRVRAELVRWFTPEAAKPNGRDHDPPLASAFFPPARRVRPKSSIKNAERKLLAAMADNPGLSVIALANAAGSSRSATGERLRQLAARGVVEKDPAGRWKLKAEEKEPGPQQPSPN